MGSLNERGGKLFFDFRYKGQRCREYTKLLDSPAHRKRAKKIMARIEAEIVLDTFNYGSYFPNSPKAEEFALAAKRKAMATSNVPFFAEFAEDWFRECEVGWRHSHRETVRRDLNIYLIPTFGDKHVDQVQKADVLTFRSSLGKKIRGNGKLGLSASRINRIVVPLRMILNEAADRFNFTSQVQNIKTLKVPRSDIDPFSLEEVQLILNTVRADFRLYYTVRFFTGMRTGEIDGLKWRYIDFKRRQILVRESFVMGQMDYTKNDHSQREIRMSEPVYQALLAQQQATSRFEFVFCNAKGNPMDYRNISKRVWYPILRYLGLQPRKPYQTRHTAATLWLAAGENPEWIARQMGHATTEMLFRVYSRYVPNLTRQDGSAFEQLLTEQLNTETQEENTK